MNTPKTIRVAVQNNGRLTEPSLRYLRSLGLKFEQPDRNLVAYCSNRDVNILYIRSSDIPEYVALGVADFGIVGENVIREKQSGVKTIGRLGFGKCSLSIAVPKDSSIKKLKDLEGERIATSYPNILTEFLLKNGINSAIISIKGSVEIAPSVNIADAICDLTQSGKTLQENGLVILEKVMDSEAVLISNTLSNNALLT